MPALKHPHKYHRYKTKENKSFFFCALPNCTHRTPVKLTLGKDAICWRCNGIFSMSVYSCNLEKPHCGNCHNIRGVKIDKEVQPSYKSIDTLNPIQSMRARMGEWSIVEDKENDKDFDL